MNTDAKLSIRMPGKVVIVDRVSQLPQVGTANTLYIVRNDGETLFYEYKDKKYHALDVGAFDESLLDDINEKLTEHKNSIDDINGQINNHVGDIVSSKEVHGIKYEDEKLYITLPDGSKVEFVGGGGGEAGDGGVVITNRRRELPKVGETSTIYIVKKDETHENQSTLYIYTDGAYHLIATFTAGGSAQEYQQVTKLGVTAPKEYELAIPRTSNFLRAPIEVLMFEQGEQDIEVGAEFDNESPNDFEENEEFIFGSNGFYLKNTKIFDGEQTDLEDKEVTTVVIDLSLDINKMEAL